jgi:hypothetical protein
MSSGERFWTRRLRWRLRGAWQWPAFAALTFGDGVILHLLPPTRRTPDLILSVIVASFGNIVLVGAVAPFLTKRLAAREQRAKEEGAIARALPTEVLFDRTATGLLLAGAVGLLAAGLAARPLVVSPTEETEANADIVSRYVAERGSDEVKRNRDTANSIRLSDGYFRTCIALDDRTKAYCLFVDVNSTPHVREDPNPVPNALFPGGGGNG